MPARRSWRARRLAALAVALRLHGVAAQPPRCAANASSLACYADAPVRAAGYFAVAASANLDVQDCVDACAADGFVVAALTSNRSPQVYCWCASGVAPGAQAAPLASCALPCPGGAGRGNCGAPGFSAVYSLVCAGPLPPPPAPPLGPALAPGRACSQPEVRGLPFCSPALPRAERVADLVGRLTLTEIASQLQARASAAVPRLGLPPFYWGSNNIHGIEGANCRVATGRCPVSWPDGVSMTASFNETAWRAMGATAGVELRALYNVVQAASPSPSLGLTSWGPTINTLRDTRWGRSQESSSECPFVAGRYGAQVSLGLQAGVDARFLLAVSGLKHFVGYSLEQYGPPEDPARYTRQTFNAAATRFDAGDTYYRPFRAAIVEGGAAGVMYAANEFQLWDPATEPPPSPMRGGVPCCLSTDLRDVLASWNFTGYRCTDGGQIEQAVALHKYVPTVDQAIGLAVAALSDIADGTEYATGLVRAFSNGNATLAGARRLAADALDVRFRLGLFDPPGDQPYERYGDADVGAPQNWAAAALASREGLILLKNAGGALPLARGAPWARAGSLAVIGPHANDTLTLQGNYGGAYCLPGAHGPVTDCFPPIYMGLLAHAPGAVYTPGCNIDSGNDAMTAAAVAAASAADAVVAVLGLDQTLEREQLDRYNMTLPAAQQALFAALVAAVAGTAKPLIVVLVHGGALAIPEVKADASAIIDALYPGVTGGAAVADCVFGLFSPGGKLPYTVYDTAYQYQYNFTNMSIAAPQVYTDPATGEQLASPGGRTYRYYTGEPLWPFGFGLSYTNWSLAWGASPPPPSAALSPAAPAVAFSVSLRNAGALAGDEVLQVYAEPDASGVAPPRPPFVPLRSLVGFARRSLAPGEAADVPFALAADDAFALTRGDGSRGPLSGARFVVRVCLGPGRGGDLLFNVTLGGF